MPRNDRSDSLSIRGDDDPRKPMKAMEQEAELELGGSEATNTGGVEHQSRAERIRDEPGSPRPAPGLGSAEEFERTTEVRPQPGDGGVTGVADRPDEG